MSHNRNRERVQVLGFKVWPTKAELQDHRQQGSVRMMLLSASRQKVEMLLMPWLGSQRFEILRSGMFVLR